MRWTNQIYETEQKYELFSEGFIFYKHKFTHIWYSKYFHGDHESLQKSSSSHPQQLHFFFRIIFLKKKYLEQMYYLQEGINKEELPLVHRQKNILTSSWQFHKKYLSVKTKIYLSAWMKFKSLVNAFLYFLSKVFKEIKAERFTFCMNVQPLCLGFKS